MKRSEAIKKLMSKVISPFEIISKENYDNGTYEGRAKRLLDFIENEIGMRPPYDASQDDDVDTGEWEPE